MTEREKFEKWFKDYLSDDGFDDEIDKSIAKDPLGDYKLTSTFIAFDAYQAATKAANDNTDLINSIFDLFYIGIEARSESTLKVNIANAKRRASCLSRVERLFITEVIDDDGDVIEDCPLNWGDNPDDYERNFSEVLNSLIATKAAVPEGWKLVPVEPTHEMCLKGNAILPSGINSDLIYKAMLAAAPEVKECAK